MTTDAEQILPFEEGLEPNSVKSYVTEWDMYVNFCRHRKLKAVPGMHVPWRIQEVRAYLGTTMAREKEQRQVTRMLEE